MKPNFSFYNYGITKISENENDTNILNIYFGHNKLPIYIYKKDIIDFIKAIIPEEELKLRKITSEKIGQCLKTDGPSVLNYLLCGRAMIIISTFRSYLEYPNGYQNDIEKIAGLNIDGQIDLQNTFNYSLRKPCIDELNPDLDNR